MYLASLISLNSRSIPVPFLWIPVDSGPIPAESSSIPEESCGFLRNPADSCGFLRIPVDSCRNGRGTVKYWQLWTQPGDISEQHSHRCAVFSTFNLIMVRYNCSPKEIYCCTAKIQYWKRDIWILLIHCTIPAAHWVMCVIYTHSQEIFYATIRVLQQFVLLEKTHHFIHLRTLMDPVTTHPLHGMGHMGTIMDHLGASVACTTIQAMPHLPTGVGLLDTQTTQSICRTPNTHTAIKMFTVKMVTMGMAHTPWMLTIWVDHRTSSHLSTTLLIPIKAARHPNTPQSIAITKTTKTMPEKVSINALFFHQKTCLVLCHFIPKNTLLVSCHWLSECLYFYCLFFTTPSPSFLVLLKRSTYQILFPVIYTIPLIRTRPVMELSK